MTGHPPFDSARPYSGQLTHLVPSAKTLMVLKQPKFLVWRNIRLNTNMSSVQISNIKCLCPKLRQATLFERDEDLAHAVVKALPGMCQKACIAR